MVPRPPEVRNRPFLHVEIACRPDLVLADVRNQDGVFLHHGGQVADKDARFHAVLARLAARRVLLPLGRTPGPSSPATRLFSTLAANSESTRRISPTIGIWTVIFLPISAGSMSIWMILAFSAICSGAATARSPTRAPQRITRSASLHGPVGAGAPMGTDHPQIIGAVHRHDADAHHRGGHRDAAVAGKGDHLFAGAGQAPRRRRSR